MKRTLKMQLFLLCVTFNLCALTPTEAKVLAKSVALYATGGFLSATSMNYTCRYLGGDSCPRGTYYDISREERNQYRSQWIKAAAQWGLIGAGIGGLIALTVPQVPSFYISRLQSMLNENKNLLKLATSKDISAISRQSVGRTPLVTGFNRVQKVSNQLELYHNGLKEVLERDTFEQPLYKESKEILTQVNATIKECDNCLHTIQAQEQFKTEYLISNNKQNLA